MIYIYIYISHTQLIRPGPPTHQLQAVHFTPSTRRAAIPVAPPQNDSSWLPDREDKNQANKKKRGRENNNLKKKKLHTLDASRSTEQSIYE